MKKKGWTHLFVLLLLSGTGCVAPIRVEENTPQGRRSYGVADHSARELSSRSINLLGNLMLTELYEKNPAQVLARLEELFKQQRRPELVSTLADAALQAAYRYRKNDDLSSRYFLSAAVYSSFFLKYLDDTKEIYAEERIRQIRIHNLAMTELFFYLKSRKIEGSSGFEIPMPGGMERLVRFAAPVYDLPVDRKAIADLTPCAHYRTVGLTHDTRVFGLGVPLVAELKPGTKDVGGRLISGLPVAVTLVGDFDMDPVTLKITGVLRYIYSRVTEKVKFGKRDLPLAADFSTPLARAVGKPQEMNFLERTFKVSEAARITGLYHLEPYDDKRIPVIFVHGLMSDARTWSQMLNTLLHDPVLRRRYQFLGFAYSSGNPIFISGAFLRKALEKLQEQLVKQKRSTKAFEKMVLIGHSMGGLLSRLQITGCREELLFKKLKLEDPESLKKKLPAAERRRMEEILNFDPLPFVKRVIFIAVPHRGSLVATGWIGRMGASLIKLPAELVRRNVEILAALVKGRKADPAEMRIGTGIDNLRPEDTMLQLLGKLKMADGVPYHSIIGNNKAWGIPGGSDGVVPYSSSHLDGADSEMVVRSGHSVQQNKLAIQEVRRILLFHVDQKETVKK